MATLTVTFKGVPLQSVDLHQDQTRIGRDPANEVQVDSLAFAEFHAVVEHSRDGYVLKSLDPGYAVAVNDQPMAEAVLRSGDQIRVGKHVLFFTDDPQKAVAPSMRESPAQDPPRSFEGNLQVLSGQRIGMVIPLKAMVTRVGKEGSGLVVLTREEHGHVISVESDQVVVTVNGDKVSPGEAPLLVSGDMIRINNSVLQYFRE